jgi:hypothetical protein
MEFGDFRTINAQGVWGLVFGFLDLATVFCLAFVCKRFSRLCRENFDKIRGLVLKFPNKIPVDSKKVIVNNVVVCDYKYLQVADYFPLSGLKIKKLSVVSFEKIKISFKNCTFLQSLRCLELVGDGELIFSVLDTHMPLLEVLDIVISNTTSYLFDTKLLETIKKLPISTIRIKRLAEIRN